MILVTQIRTRPDDPPERAEEKALQKIGMKRAEVVQIERVKTSVDGRHGRVEMVSSFAVYLKEKEAEIAQRAASNEVQWKEEPAPYRFPHWTGNRKPPSPVIIGFGPAGLMAGLALAQAGLCPIIFEQGEQVEERTKAVRDFWTHGKLNTRSNVQFGEGGAGTFSDGKLTTRIGDARCAFVLDTFVQFGAPEEIRHRAKPHIGTDGLLKVVKNIREEILRLGGQIHFGTEVTELLGLGEKVKGIHADGAFCGGERVILAIGHSARKLFSHLAEQGEAIEKKPFSMGVRIEHLQEKVDQVLYGEFAGHPALGSAEYQFSHREKNGRGVYTFCMCPGGSVVASSSEEGGVVTNGMSYYARNGKNANSALVVSVLPEDTEGSVLSGMDFQRMLEQKAFLMGGRTFFAPAQDVGSFLAGQKGLVLGGVEPTYTPGVTPTNLNDWLPPNMSLGLKQGLQIFDRKMIGFADKAAILTAIESRTSSPIRILRNERFEALKTQGLYPCGEGAGYAGGIMSACVDGLRVAEAIVLSYCDPL